MNDKKLTYTLDEECPVRVDANADVWFELHAHDTRESAEFAQYGIGGLCIDFQLFDMLTSDDTETVFETLRIMRTIKETARAQFELTNVAV